MKMSWFNVYLKGKLVDSLNYDSRYTAQEVQDCESARGGIPHGAKVVKVQS